MHFTFARFVALILISLTLTKPSAILADDVPKVVVQLAHAATVRITAHSDDKWTVGSGAFIGQKGAFAYVLTAEHVIDIGELTIETFHRDPTGTAIATKADVVLRSLSADLAVIRVPISNDLPVPLKVSSLNRDPAIDRPAVLLGCANGDSPGWMVFHVHSETERSQGAKFWLTQEAPRPGQSGGPLVDADGYLIGVCSASWGDQGLFGSTEEIHALLKRAKLTSLLSSSDEPPTHDDSPIVARRPTRPPASARRPSLNPDVDDDCPNDDDEIDFEDGSSIRISGHGIVLSSGTFEQHGRSSSIIVTDNGNILIQRSGSGRSVRVEIVDGDVRVIQGE